MSAAGVDGVDRSFLIHGRVQGVGFRWWTAGEARRLGLRGCVRNRADGAVEVRIAGPAEQVAELARRLRQGPPGARVETVEESRGQLPLPAGFEIVR